MTVLSSRLPFNTLLLLVLTMIVPLAATAAAPQPWQQWQTHENTANPLVGKIYDVRTGQTLTPEALADRLAKARFVLLGETHDNPDHHRLQAYLIRELARRGRKPAIVMEQINADQAGPLKLFQSGKFKTAVRLGPAIGWAQQGWPDWKFYQPIAANAFAAGLTIYAGDSSRDMNRKIGKEGFKSVPAARRKDLGIDLPLGQPLENQLLNELVGSHCNLMAAERMRPMARVQRYRDAHLARAMRLAGGKDGAVLIAGSGHVRTDRGVPWYLRGHQLRSASLMFLEAQPGAKSIGDLVPRAPNGKPAVDYAWVTPGAARPDPCEGLRKRMKTAPQHP